MSDYLAHFNLADIPFKNTPDCAFFVDLERSHSVESALFTCLQGGHGLAVLTGELGTGKTTLTRHLIRSLPDTTHVFWLMHPPETPIELYSFILQDLGMQPAVHQGKTLLLEAIRALLTRKAMERPYLLVMDEAHQMFDPVLDSLKYLNNLEHDGRKLLQILLVGQPELDAVLDSPNHKALAQRISCRRRLRRLSPEQSLIYIQSRLLQAGATLELFSPTALKRILVHAQGTPRIINNICHEALMSACSRNAKHVCMDDVARAMMYSHPQVKAGETSDGKSSPPVIVQKRSPAFLIYVAVVFTALVLMGIWGGATIWLDLSQHQSGQRPADVAMPHTYRASIVKEKNTPFLNMVVDIEQSDAVEANDNRSDEHSEHEILAEPDVIEQLAAEGDMDAHGASPYPFDPLAGQSPPRKTFAVQIGTFEDADNAQGIYHFWREKGYPVYQYAVGGEEGARVRYVVRMGGYDTMEKAARMTRMFNQREQESAVAVEVADSTHHPEVGPQPSTALSFSWPETLRLGGPVALYRQLANAQGRSFRQRIVGRKPGEMVHALVDAGFLQVGVHHSQEQAYLDLDRFLAFGWQGSVFSSEDQGVIQHQVLIGPFSSLAEAEAVQGHAQECADALDSIGRFIPRAGIELLDNIWTMVVKIEPSDSGKEILLAATGWPVLQKRRQELHIGPFQSEEDAKAYQALAGQGQGWGPMQKLSRLMQAEQNRP